MNSWDELRAKNEELLSRPRFTWTPQRKQILRARAQELASGQTFWFGKPSDGGFSDEWKKRQLASMRKHVQVHTDEELIAWAREEGLIPKDDEAAS